MSTKKETQEVSVYGFKHLHYVGSDTSTADVGTLGTYTSKDVTYGSNLRNWKQLIRHGQNATTTLTGRYIRKARIDSQSTELTVYSFSAPTGWSLGGEQYGWKTFVPQSNSFGAIDLQSVYDAAVVGYLKRVHDEYRSFQTGIFVGELRESLHMLRNPVESLVKGMQSYLKVLKKKSSYVRISTGVGSLRKTKVKRLTRTSVLNDMIADTWLEYSFGWKPFINDIRSAISGLNKLVDPQEQWTRVHFSSKGGPVPIGSEYDVPALRNGDLVGTKYVVRDYESASVKLYGAVTTKPTSTPSRVADIFGIKLEEFVPTVWELTPWSFLVDYFADVGGLIDALSTNQSYIRWTSRTDFQTIEAKPLRCVRQSMAPINGGYFVTYRTATSSVTGKATLKLVTRRPWTQPLVPSLIFRIPGTSTRWLNMAALVTTSKRVSQSLLRRR